MNWLQKIAKVMEVRHIPYQIYAALQYTTRKDWRIHKQQSFRDWNSNRRDAAIFKAHYTTKVVYNDEEQSEVAVMVMWQLPFRSKDEDLLFFDTATGLDGLLFQAFLTLTPVIQGQVYYDDKEEGNSELVRTPTEIAEWVEHVLKNGFSKESGDDFDSPNNDDDPDDSPKWPYPEDEYTKPETDEEMANMRGSRIRGNRMI